jgi:hypothetical protein
VERYHAYLGAQDCTEPAVFYRLCEFATHTLEGWQFLMEIADRSEEV